MAEERDDEISSDAGGVPAATHGSRAVVIAVVVVVMAGLAVAYPLPWHAAGLAGIAIAAAVVLAGRRAPERRLGTARAERRRARWPDSGMKVLAEALTDPCIITDGAGIVRYVNAEATARFGAITPGDPLSFRLRTTALHDALDRVIALNTAETVPWTERIPTERWLEAHLSPIHLPLDRGSPDRRPDFVLVVVEDLTEKRRTDRMRADFVANASHELRTPLASLAGFIETLQGPARNDPVARDRFLAIMATQAARMKRLIDDLLSLSRIEMKAHLRPDGSVDLHEVVAHVVDSLTPLARDSGVSLRFDSPGGPMPVRGDRDELVQVFANLVENAIKYGAAGERVDIEARAETAPGGRPGWAVAVTDHGPGIAAEHLPRLTERFYRADIVSSREKQGTGLGLAIVKHILTRHDARLAIESKPGEGATFTVRIGAGGPA